MASGDLTTLTRVKSYLHIASSDTTQDALLNYLIAGVSARIETLCGRIFPATDYIELSNTGTRQARAQVRNKPIIRVNNVLWGYATAFQVKYIGAAIQATIQSTPTGVILNTTSAAGVAASTTLPYTIYPTFSTLVTAINAVSGFIAQLQGGIDGISKYIYCTAGTSLVAQGVNYVFGLGYPNINVFQYTFDPVFGTIGFQPLSSLDYFFPQNGGGLPQMAFPGAYQGLTIDYRGGYETIPADIDYLAQELVANAYNISTHDQTLVSESLGDYSYAIGDALRNCTMFGERVAQYKTIALAGGMG